MSTSEENTNKIDEISPELQRSYQRMIEEINQLTANTNDLTMFCDSVDNAIQNVFNYYSVNLYIIDSDRKWAVLKAGTSGLSQTAMRHKHKHALAGTSLVSRAVNNHSACVAEVNPEDPLIPYPSVELPPVHSEFCMPLISQKNVVGVLDIQSSEHKAFREDECIFYLAVAEQIVSLLDDKKLL
jgi:putative methionine-R-sulfoxide reductase with GAF domain